MILSRGIRQQRVLRAVSSATSTPSTSTSTSTSQCPSRRQLHSVPKLTYGELWSKEGIPDLLSPEGYNVAWTQYQGYMVYKLNEYTAGTLDANTTTHNLLLKTARQADKAALFNHASMAFNNHFFFNSLHSSTCDPTSSLSAHITHSFSSLASLRATFLATASATFGPSFVWLVHLRDTYPPSAATLAILTTYNAGSPLPGAHYRLQPVDMATADPGAATPPRYAVWARHNAPQARGAGAAGVVPGLRGGAGSFGVHSVNASKTPPGVQDLIPLLGVSTWEHTWLTDWGAAGKKDFLEAWWQRIDWGVVEGIFGNVPKPGGSRGF